MEENKNMILTMEYTDGTTGKRELLSIFKAENGHEYAALLPLNEDETPVQNADIELVRAKKFINEDDKEDYIIEVITSEVEIETAKEAFSELLNNEVTTIGNDEEASNNDLPIISFKNGNGQFEDWKVIDVFDYNNRKYIALIPSENEEVGNLKIHLMRLRLTLEGDLEGCEVTSIPSDLEYDGAAGEFERRVYEANNT